MRPKLNVGSNGILISAIVLIISVFLIIDRLLVTGQVQLILADGKAVPVESTSLFTINDVLFFLITAWLGGMSFLYIILFSREREIPEFRDEKDELKREFAVVPESESKAKLAAALLEGDEKILFDNIIDNDGILQRELVLKTGFSEPKVSRLLDKAERKGLVMRQRDGMGNRIFLIKR